MPCDAEYLRAIQRVRKLLEAESYENLTAADKALYLAILAVERGHAGERTEAAA